MNHEKMRLIERLIEDAWMERGLYGSQLKYRPNRLCDVGTFILNLSENERGLLTDATSKDFSSHRMDYVLMVVPEYYKSLAKQAEEHRRRVSRRQKHFPD